MWDRMLGFGANSESRSPGLVAIEEAFGLTDNTSAGKGKASEKDSDHVACHQEHSVDPDPYVKPVPDSPLITFSPEERRCKRQCAEKGRASIEDGRNGDANEVENLVPNKRKPRAEEAKEALYSEVQDPFRTRDKLRHSP